MGNDLIKRTQIIMTISIYVQTPEVGVSHAALVGDT